MRNKNLKRFLTTASALGMIAIGAGEAGAVIRNSNGAVVFSTGANLAGGAGAGNAMLTGQYYRIDGAHTTAANLAGLTIPAIAIAAGEDPGVMTVSQNIIIGAVSNNDSANGNAANSSMALTFGGASVVTLTGAGATAANSGFTSDIAANAATTYNKLGKVDFNNTASTLLVTGNGLTLAGEILSTGSNGVAANGVIKVTGATGDNTFSGLIGGGAVANAVGAIDIAATAGTTTFSNVGQAMAGKVTLSGAGNVAFTGNGGLKVTTGDFDASASTGTVGVTHATGDLIVDAGNVTLGSGVSTFGRHLTATKGSINTGSAVTNVAGNVNAATTLTTGAGRLTVTGTTIAGTGLVVGAGGITAGNAVTVTKGNLDLSATDAANASTFVNNITVTDGNFVTGAGLVTLKTAGALTMTAANSEVTVGAGGLVLKRDATFTAGGKVQLNGNDLTVDATDNAVTLSATANAADIVTNTAGTGTVNLTAQAHALAIKSNIGEANKAVALIAVTGNNTATIGGAGSTTTVVNATKTTIGNGTTLAVNSAANSIVYSGVIDGGGAANNGTLAINGLAGNGKKVTFNNSIGSTNTIATITHGAGARGDAIYKDTVKVGTDITSAAASVVVFEKAVEAGNAITLAGASINTFNDTVKTVQNVTLAGASKATFKGAATIGGAVAVNTSTVTFDANAAITGNLTANAAGISTITFNDTATIGGAVTVDGASTLTFAKDVTVTGNTITLTNAADKLNIRGNLKGSIAAAGADRGIVTFGNGTNANITVSGNGAGNAGIGANAARLATVNLNLAGGTLTLTEGKYNAANTTFTTDDKLVLTAVDTNRLGTVTTKVAGSAGTIVVNQQNLETDGNIGAEGYRLKELKLAHANGTLTITPANVLHTDITTASANTNTVIFGAGADFASAALNIGTEAAPLLQVQGDAAAARNVTVGKIYAKNIVTNKATLTADVFNGITNVTGGTAVVNDKGTIGKVVTTANDGTLTLTGSATITGPVGAVGAVIDVLNLAGTAATNVVTFKDDAIFATTVDHDAATFKLEKATTITSTDYNATGSTFDIGANVLNLTTDNLTISGDIKVNMSMGDRNAVFTGINTLVTTAATDKVTLNISSGGGLLADTNLITLFEDRAGDALVSAADALTSANVTLGANSNRFITGLKYLGTADEVKTVVDAAVAAGVTPAAAAAEITAGKLVITSSASLDKLTTSPKKPGVSEFANQIVTQFNDRTLKGDALKFANTLADLSLEDSTKALNAVADRSVADVGNNVTGATVAAVTQAMTGRLDLTNAMLTASADQGIAAGDSAEKFGVWGQVIGGTATQRMRKEVSGFQSRMAGILVGGDTMISEKTTIGVLAGNAGSNVKHKDSKAGDKTKANSWLFGLYGSYDRIADTNFFTQGNLTVAQTTVNVKEGRTTANAVVGGPAVKETAKAKYDVLGLAAEAIVGYKFMFDNSYVAPTVGLRYNYFGDTSYTQTGTANQNLKVASKATSTVSGLAGLKLGTSVDMDGTNIMPEVHANVSYAFNAPSVKTTYAIDGMKDVAYKGPKPSKFGANFGAGVMAEADGFEYGVGYDANVGDKYLAHQGSLKVKVKF